MSSMTVAEGAAQRSGRERGYASSVHFKQDYFFSGRLVVIGWESAKGFTVQSRGDKLFSHLMTNMFAD